MYCECGFMMDARVYSNNGIITCPFCGKQYEACAECGIYFNVNDMIDGLCHECLDSIINGE